MALLFQVGYWQGTQAPMARNEQNTSAQNYILDFYKNISYNLDKLSPLFRPLVPLEMAASAKDGQYTLAIGNSKASLRDKKGNVKNFDNKNGFLAPSTSYSPLLFDVQGGSAFTLYRGSKFPFDVNREDLDIIEKTVKEPGDIAYFDIYRYASIDPKNAKIEVMQSHLGVALDYSGSNPIPKAYIGEVEKYATGKNDIVFIGLLSDQKGTLSIDEIDRIHSGKSKDYAPFSPSNSKKYEKQGIFFAKSKKTGELIYLIPANGEDGEVTQYYAVKRVDNNSREEIEKREKDPFYLKDVSKQTALRICTTLQELKEDAGLGKSRLSTGTNLEHALDFIAKNPNSSVTSWNVVSDGDSNTLGAWDNEQLEVWDKTKNAEQNFEELKNRIANSAGKISQNGQLINNVIIYNEYTIVSKANPDMAAEKFQQGIIDAYTSKGFVAEKLGPIKIPPYQQILLDAILLKNYGEVTVNSISEKVKNDLYTLTGKLSEPEVASSDMKSFVQNSIGYSERAPQGSMVITNPSINGNVVTFSVNRLPESKSEITLIRSAFVLRQAALSLTALQLLIIVDRSDSANEPELKERIDNYEKSTKEFYKKYGARGFKLWPTIPLFNHNQQPNPPNDMFLASLAAPNFTPPKDGVVVAIIQGDSEDNLGVWRTQMIAEKFKKQNCQLFIALSDPQIDPSRPDSYWKGGTYRTIEALLKEVDGEINGRPVEPFRLYENPNISMEEFLLKATGGYVVISPNNAQLQASGGQTITFASGAMASKTQSP